MKANQLLVAIATDGRIFFQTIDGGKSYLTGKEVADKLDINIDDVSFNQLQTDKDGDLELEYGFTSNEAKIFVSELQQALDDSKKRGNKEIKEADQFCLDFNSKK